MKRVWIFVLFLSMILPTSTALGAAAPNISVTLDGKKLVFSSKSIEEKGTTLVPLRTIFEALGAKVMWEPATQTVKASKDGVNIRLVLGQALAFRDNDVIKLTTKPRTIHNVTYVPLRFISESFGCTIALKGSQISITSAPRITTSQPSVVVPTPIPGASTGQTTPPTTSTSIQEIGKMSNRVVYIEVYDKNNKVFATGSGVVVGSSGEILTNYHVIEGAASATIEFNDQRSFTTSTILIKDEKRDLALLKIPADSLPTVSLGDSSSLELGQEVVAIGSPLGFKNSLTSGVVSSTNRSVEGQNYIQISTPIDHGSSGGALFNMKGELVGITSAAFVSSANINLAIPSNDVKSFLGKTRSTQMMIPSTSTGSTGTTTPPSTGSTPSTGKQTAESLKDYLNDNYSVINYEKLDLELDWIVTKSEDGKGFNIGGTMTSASAWSKLKGYQDADDSFMPGLIYFITDELHKDLGLKENFIALFLNIHMSTYPKGFPAEDITKEGTGYRLMYAFAYGRMDYSTGYFYYSTEPENEDSVQRSKMQ